MTEHNDLLQELNSHLPIREKLVATHNSLKKSFPFIVRIAIALYDQETTILKTYIHSSGDANPLPHYQAPLDEAPSLKNILEQGLPRIINNMVTFEDGTREHTQRIGRQGYAASYTLPMFNDGNFIGFLFFNADQTDVFTDNVLQQLDIYAHMISLMVIKEINTVKVMSAALKTTNNLTHLRDPETGTHLDRMSRYSRLIANALADKFKLDDDYIENIFMFSPLHDIGKIAIPDNILLKPGKLDDDERSIMETHALKGREIVDELLNNFGFKHFQHMQILRNIAEFHHEAVNGSGYPVGLEGDDIPLEARIVAVADVFDALTSKRPYKEAWSNEQAIETLRQLSGEKLDQDCVQALIDNLDKVEAIQQQFRENIYL